MLRGPLGCAAQGSRRGSACHAGEARAKAAIASQELIDLAVRSTSCIGADYAGVDIIQAQDGGFLVLEVNSMPAWNGLQAVSRQNIADHLVGAFLDAQEYAIDAREARDERRQPHPRVDELLKLLDDPAAADARRIDQHQGAVAIKTGIGGQEKISEITGGVDAEVAAVVDRAGNRGGLTVADLDQARAADAGTIR
jgi:hypothetical protein